MLTHDELIFCLCEMTGVKPSEHGRRFLVGMDIVDGEQVASASVDYWGYDDIPLPSDEDVHAFWLNNKDRFVDLTSYMMQGVVPQKVTRAQGKAALIQAGLWQEVLDYVDGIDGQTEKMLALVALNDATHWRRDSPFLNAAAQALGLTSEQLDDLFTQAAGIEL